MRQTRRVLRARGWPTPLLFLLASACGGGGAVLPTEAGDGLPGGGDGGGTNQPPIENPGGGDGGGGGEGPVSVTIVIGDDTGFMPGSVAVPAGSTVTWSVVDGRHDVTFIGRTPDGGSIGETREDESASRTFDEPGTYEYFCARHDDDGETGVVIVQASGAGGGDGDGDPEPPTNVVTVTTPGDSFSPATATIAAGGTVRWQITGDEHNVTFTGAAPPGGNIPNTEGQTVSREFPTAGRFDYFCTRHSGMNGAVVVQ